MLADGLMLIPPESKVIPFPMTLTKKSLNV
jgi:hypothetical protein